MTMKKKSQKGGGKKEEGIYKGKPKKGKEKKAIVSSERLYNTAQAQMQLFHKWMLCSVDSYVRLVVVGYVRKTPSAPSRPLMKGASLCTTTVSPNYIRLAGPSYKTYYYFGLP
jgi:hypothetical protein